MGVAGLWAVEEGQVKERLQRRSQPLWQPLPSRVPPLRQHKHNPLFMLHLFRVIPSVLDLPMRRMLQQQSARAAPFLSSVPVRRSGYPHIYWGSEGPDNAPFVHKRGVIRSTSCQRQADHEVLLKVKCPCSLQVFQSDYGFQGHPLQSNRTPIPFLARHAGLPVCSCRGVPARWGTSRIHPAQHTYDAE